FAMYHDVFITHEYQLIFFDLFVLLNPFNKIILFLVNKKLSETSYYVKIYLYIQNLNHFLSELGQISFISSWISLATSQVRKPKFLNQAGNNNSGDDMDEWDDQIEIVNNEKKHA
ncbi:MAG: hypothetical protein ACTSRW_13775, partial [Candidatus Helarchaeota archaeon]